MISFTLMAMYETLNFIKFPYELHFPRAPPPSPTLSFTSSFSLCNSLFSDLLPYWFAELWSGSSSTVLAFGYVKQWACKHQNNMPWNCNQWLVREVI
ncbi:hypothetical protein Dimus_013955 [Dionaea muscipula]